MGLFRLTLPFCIPHILYFQMKDNWPLLYLPSKILVVDEYSVMALHCETSNLAGDKVLGVATVYQNHVGLFVTWFLSPDFKCPSRLLRITLKNEHSCQRWILGEAKI